MTASQVVELYHDHGTSEQFHNEFKTDMDIERLPSGKFATNALVLECGLVAYNALRLCGQESLRQDKKMPPDQKMPIRKRVRRRRLRSVIQDMIYMGLSVIALIEYTASTNPRNAKSQPQKDDTVLSKLMCLSSIRLAWKALLWPCSAVSRPRTSPPGAGRRLAWASVAYSASTVGHLQALSRWPGS